MPYINKKTEEFGLNIYQVREANPDTSVPEGADCGDCVWYFESSQPVSSSTTKVVEVNPALVGGVLTQQWAFRDMTPAELAAKAEEGAGAIADKIDALWRAADKYVSGYISGVAVGILTIGVMQEKPKAQAVTAWSSAVWAEYYRRKALVTVDSVDDHNFNSFGPIPHSVPELQAEVGM